MHALQHRLHSPGFHVHRAAWVRHQAGSSNQKEWQAREDYGLVLERPVPVPVHVSVAVTVTLAATGPETGTGTVPVTMYKGLRP